LQALHADQLLVRPDNHLSGRESTTATMLCAARTRRGWPRSG
jgi:hypothetical protein